jgi:hypothetical protein
MVLSMVPGAQLPPCATELDEAAVSGIEQEPRSTRVHAPGDSAAWAHAVPPQEVAA